MADLAKAYVQMLPSTQGFGSKLISAIGGDVSSAGSSSGASFGGELISKLKTVVAAAGIGKIISSALGEGAALQQSIGGIETLFKGASDTMIAYADQAYKTTGLSANSYMETVTSFSAALISSLGGDTAKAAEAANTALVDMSDNANKMGTDMQSIQNAYQGFAKQNYTMLDNLKLGYGGTKSEMERLLADATKLSGVEYKIDNLSDVYSAIHVIQTELGITGTTAKEAESTFSGSFASMKAAAQNLMANMTLGRDLGPSLEALAQTVSTFVFGNLLPMLWNMVTSIPQVASGLLSGAWSSISGWLASAPSGAMESMISGLSGGISDFVSRFSAGLTEGLPQIIEGAKTIGNGVIDGIVQTGPMLFQGMADLITTGAQGLLENTPMLLEAGGEIVTNIINGIVEMLPSLLETGWNLITSLITSLGENLPQIIETGFEVVTNIINGILNALPSIFDVAMDIVTNICDTIASTDWVTVGTNILQSIVNGILSLISSVAATAQNIITTLCSKFSSTNWGQLGSNALTGIINGLGSMLGSLIGMAGQLVQGIWNTFTSIDWGSIGSNIINGIISGISGMASALWDSAVNVAKGALDSAKAFLGIKSPSRKFRDEVGAQMSLGTAFGVKDNAGVVTDAVEDMTADALSVSIADLADFNPLAGYAVNINGQNSALSRALEALGSKKTELNISLVLEDGKEIARYTAPFMQKELTELDRLTDLIGV